MGNLDAAEESILRSIELSEAIGDRVNLAKALVTLGDISHAKGNFESALEQFGKAARLGSERGIQEVEWRALRGLARSHLGLGDTDSALREYLAAADVVEGMRASIKIEEFKNGFIVNKQDLYEEIVQLLLNLGQTRQAFLFAERSRARSFIDLLGNRRLNLKDEIDQTLYDRLLALKGRITEAEDRFRTAPDDRKEEAEGNLIGLRNEYQNLLIEIKSESPQLTSFVTVEPIELDRLFQLLGNEVALVEYMVLKDEVVAWTVFRNEIRVTRIPQDREELDQKILAFRNLLQEISPLSEESRGLHDRIVGPVLAGIEGASYLAVVPHGSLHYLSFAALADDRGYLLEKYPLFFLPSASVFEYTVARRIDIPKKNLKVMAFGNPDLGNFNYDLPLAELEAKAIPWDFPNSDVFTNEEATESRIWDNVGDYNVVHIASHGEFDPVNPLFSSLKLAKDEESDGNLEVNEIFSMNLNADLVTLSACQTGLGHVTAGDEVVGLNRAFLYAGTHSLISTLWRVSDLSSAVLIKHFYRNYVGDNKAQSLRKAQLQVKSLSPHPSYWAGFILTGDYQ
jgi:CHAT domain-containing protein